MSAAKHIAKNLVTAWLKHSEIKARNSKVGVNFVYEGWNFLLWHDADDPLFFRLTLPGITTVRHTRVLPGCCWINCCCSA